MRRDKCLTGGTGRVWGTSPICSFFKPISNNTLTTDRGGKHHSLLHKSLSTWAQRAVVLSLCDLFNNTPSMGGGAWLVEVDFPLLCL